MNKQRTSPRKKKTTKPMSDDEYSAFDDDNKVKDANRTKDTKLSKEEEKQNDADLNLSDASSDDIFAPVKNSSVSVSNCDFDSILFKKDEDKSLDLDSNETEQSENSPEKQSDKIPGKQSKNSSKILAEKSLGKQSKNSPKKKSDENSPRKQGKKSKRTPNKKEKFYAESSKSDSSSDEDSELTKNRGTNSRARNIDSIALGDQSRKEETSKSPEQSLDTDGTSFDKESSRGMPDIEKEPKSGKAFSDDELSSGVPDIEKIFETVDEERAREDRNKLFFAEQRSRSPSPAKMSPQNKDDQTESIGKKSKDTLAGKNLELNKPSPSKAKTTKNSHQKHDKSSTSLSKDNGSIVSENVENDKTDATVLDLGTKIVGRSRSKNTHSNSSPNKASSKGEKSPDKASSKGEKSPDKASSKGEKGNNKASSKDEKNRPEKQTISESGVKKPGRGRPRKSAVLDPNGELPSRDILNSISESSLSKTKGNKVRANELRRQSTENSDNETGNTEKETTSSPQSKSTPNSGESSPVFAVKSKPSPKKRKKDEIKKKSKKLSDVEKPSSADTNADDSPVPDKNGSPASNPKDSGQATRAASTGAKRKPIYTSSDDSDSEEESPKATPTAKSKKLKREFSCHKCDATFARTQQLFDHICEGKRDRGFACERCDKIYKLRSTYINHKIIHSKKKPYKCGLCGKKSASQSNHLYHMKNSHPNHKPYPCEFFPCKKSYATRTEQKEHYKTHKRFICPYCEKIFFKDSTLLHHKYKAHEVFFS